MASLTVFIVEDEPLIGAAMEMLVEDIGGSVLGPFMNLRDGLAGVESANQIDCALLDCNLGKDSSIPIAEALASKGIPFAFTSGNGVKDIEERFRDRPIFVKPVDENKLKQFLQQFVPA
jgi:CheY-like chemotaxis protein